MVNREKVIGRLPEKRVLDTVLASNDPELVAVYGRRRVGKTFLIREHCRPHLFADQPFAISKSYAQSLDRKLRVFRNRSGRRQTLFLTMITPYGIAPNQYSDELVTNEVVLDDFFA